ncbi:inactive protein RESTRICTED TEV MOVEMENT 2-like [Senna tora]|uniref:Inactive protein RESTRICTED TEV MOVEMENT 2-like n=1 Tax=Senna tora TaxID=362788 RepID=A0A834WEI1_9FABA|nr:inactive protein RESTRICTED TEV MOVEMENT 2-like [Senna tora]
MEKASSSSIHPSSMETKAAEATGNRFYEIFEPYCKWNTHEAQDILEVHLKGFRKEQLKVQTNNKGILKIHGERPLDATKWSRFQKELKLDKNCNPNDIRAKFSRDILSITIPKKPKEEANRSIHKDGHESTSSEDKKKKRGRVWGVRISKRRMAKVAVVIVAVVVVVAIGTQIARLVRGHRHTLEEAPTKDSSFMG